MTKTVTHIDCPKEWESENDWDSHRPLLWLSLENTNGFITEFGSGEGSTYLLDRYSYENKRAFTTWETNWDYYDILKGIKSVKCFIGDWIRDTENIANQGLLFIDCAPGEVRKDLVFKFSDKSEVILIHDSEPGAEYVYGLSPVLSTFKYRLDYTPEGKPHTVAVSNTINVTYWV